VVTKQSAGAGSAAFYEYLGEMLDEDKVSTKILSYQPHTAVTEQRSDYFRQPRYPYAQRLSLSEYLHNNYPIQIELVKLQRWIQTQQLKVMLIFEGRDTAGKGSMVKSLVHNLNPRYVRVVALDKPTRHERSQWYFQRYTRHLPGSGELVLFDRSWYNRAGVERVMGFCSESEYWRFVRQAPQFEQMLVDTGITLIKFYLSISKEEQSLRIEERRVNPLKQWKLSAIDQQAQARWDEYTNAKEKTLQATATSFAPWTLVKADDKLRARLAVARFVLSCFDYADKDESVASAADPLLVANAG
jgi:polyphosphate kinase 2